MGRDELAWRAHLEPGVWVVGVVVLEPSGEQRERGDGVRQGRDLDVVPFQGLDEGLGHAVAGAGLLTGVKQGLRPSWRAKMRVSFAV